MVRQLKDWKVRPDKQKNGIREYMIRAEKREELYEFITCYVQKVYSDTLIMKELHQMTGCSFLDLIRPGNIAYLISLIKNVQDMWDQTVWMKALGAAAHKEKEKKLRLLFTAGIGKKKEQGKHMWSKEGKVKMKRVAVRETEPEKDIGSCTMSVTT